MSAIDPFPAQYPAAATPDATLQTALDNARAGLPAGQQPTIADVPITLIALGDETPYAAASFRGDEMDYSASMLKIAALYAAHELRAAQRLADAVQPTDTAQLIAAHIVKIFGLAFLLEVTPPPIAEHQLVFRPLVTDTDR